MALLLPLKTNMIIARDFVALYYRCSKERKVVWLLPHISIATENYVTA